MLRFEASSRFHVACEAEQLKSVEFLIHYGRISIREIPRATPLHAAAYTGNGPIVRLLIAKGADTSARDNYGQVPLHKAAIALSKMRSTGTCTAT